MQTRRNLKYSLLLLLILLLVACEPVVTIVAPQNNEQFEVGEEITFSGSALDLIAGELDNQLLVWTSSINGEIGTGRTFTRDDLSKGTHEITLTATNSQNEIGTATITIIIGEGTTTFWKTEMLDTDDFFIVGESTSLAVDSQNHPHIIFTSSYRPVSSPLLSFNPLDLLDECQNGSVKYAYYDGEWLIENVVCQSAVDVALALDNQNSPHVIYDGYHTYLNGEWCTETILENSRSFYNSIAIDDLDHLHVSFNNFGLGYAYFDDGWEVEIVDDTGAITGFISSIATDSFGDPHIVYHIDEPEMGIKYAYKNDTQWGFENITDGHIINFSLAIDNQNAPHICYTTRDEGLFYTFNLDDSWETELVDSQGEMDKSCKLVLDSKGYPHIGYICNSALKHAWKAKIGWHIETATTGNLGKEASFSLDGNDIPHFSYRLINNNSINHCFRLEPYIKEYSDSGCLENSSVDAEEYPGCGEEEIVAKVEGNSIHVIHLNATYNCCPDEIEVTLSAEGNNLKLIEQEILTTPCDCLCCYNVEAEITGLIPGEYTVEVCWNDWETHGELCKTIMVEIPN